jgi:hypothetical protein
VFVCGKKVAESGKAIFIFRGNSSTPEQKYLFSVSIHKYFIKAARETKARSEEASEKTKEISKH